MIGESYPWKRDLLRDADIIERWAAKKTNSEYRYMLLEKKVFLSAFVIRKLIEDHKLTDDIKEYSILCQVYPARGTDVDIINWPDIDEHYDLSSQQRAEIRGTIWLTYQPTIPIYPLSAKDKGYGEYKS